MSPKSQVDYALASNSGDVQHEVAMELALECHTAEFCHLVESTQLDNRHTVKVACTQTSRTSAAKHREFVLSIIDHFKGDLGDVGSFCVDRARYLHDPFYLSTALEYMPIEELFDQMVIVDEGFVFVNSSTKSLIERWAEANTEMTEPLVRLLAADPNFGKSWPWFNLHKNRLELIESTSEPANVGFKKKM